MAKHPNLFFTKLGDVKSPARAHTTDAGFDFFAPNDMEPITLKAHEKAVIPLKVKVSFGEGYVLILKDKSGVALKKNLIVCGGVIDAGYTGEVVVQLQNYSEGEVVIQPGEKIVQGVLLPISVGMPQELTMEEYAKLTAHADRGANGHGSTGSF